MRRTTEGDIREQVAAINKALGNPTIQFETHDGQPYERAAFMYYRTNGSHQLVHVMTGTGVQKSVLYAETKSSLSEQLYAMLKGIELTQAINLKN